MARTDRYSTAELFAGQHVAKGRSLQELEVLHRELLHVGATPDVLTVVRAAIDWKRDSEQVPA